MSLNQTVQWLDLLKQILAGDLTPQSTPLVRQAVTLAGQMLERTDLNGNAQVEPVAGEGGARTAHQHAYYMFDIAVYAPDR